MSKLSDLLNTIIEKVNETVRTENQTLTEDQKAQARKNIGAIDETKLAEELAKRGQLKPEFAESAEWLEANGDTSLIYILPNGDMWAYMLTEVESAPTYTNILPLAVNADGTPYVGNNGEKGYKTGWRLNSSKVEKEQARMCCTGFMPVSGNGILRVKTSGKIVDNTISGSYLFAFEADRATSAGLYSGFSDGRFSEIDGVWTLDLSAVGVSSSARYVRLSIPQFDESIVITYNEEITEGGGTSTGYAWAFTGRNIAPADYEDRIIAVEKTTAKHTNEIKALKKAVTSGGTDDTEADALKRIEVWDKPVYDNAEVTLLGTDRNKPALTSADKTISAIYAKYRALMAAHPKYIKETNMGKSTSSSTFTAVDMLRFDFKEPDGMTEPSLGESALHETKPKIILLSGIHNEWAGVWGLYYALEEIATNPDFDDIRRNAHIIVIPCANPYGLTSQTAVEGWTMSHVNANGVAIHNNFGAGWVQRGNLGEYNYSGTEPYSELETQYIDAVMAENSDAIAFVTCHNNDYSTYYGSHVIWASSATYYMCNLAFRLVDKMTKAWLNKYGQTLRDAIDQYKINMDADDYRLGRATMSSSAGTEQKNATKYGIQATNLEIPRMMYVFSGKTDCSSEVMTRGAEVYANFFRTILAAYDPHDKKDYAPNLPWED